MDDPAADRLSLLESLAARLARATAKLPPRADGAADARGAGAGADADANAAGRVSNAAGAARPPSSSSPLEIGDLVSVADAILPFFDKMGPVFHVARGEFHGKVQAVRAAGPGHLPLRDLVAADVAAQRATAKGSATRSLHRLGGTLLFIKVLFERLLVAGGGMHHSVPAEGRSPRAAAAAAADEGGGGGGGAAAAAAAADEGGGGGGGFAGMMRRLSGAGGFSGGVGGSTLVTLREAAGEAYEEALAPWHTLMIKGVVRAGMLTLPSREHFLQACGETELTARPHAAAAVDAAARLLAEIERLLRGIDMPTSDVWLWPV